MRRRRGMRGQGGFTYVGLIVLVAILGLVGAATLKADSLLRRAAAERELLEIGAAYSEALRSYAAATPQGFSTAPPTLRDLLKDPRFPGTRRHLRRIFVDPVTGGDEWGIQYQGDKVGVLAIYSLSQAQPLKQANFDARFQHFENKAHLSDWKFTAQGQAVAPPADTPMPGTPLPGTPPPAPPETPETPQDLPPEAPPEAPPETPPDAPPEQEPEPEPEPRDEAPPPAPPESGPARTESGV